MLYNSKKTYNKILLVDEQAFTSRHTGASIFTQDLITAIFGQETKIELYSYQKLKKIKLLLIPFLRELIFYPIFFAVFYIIKHQKINKLSHAIFVNTTTYALSPKLKNKTLLTIQCLYSQQIDNYIKFSKPNIKLYILKLIQPLIFILEKNSLKKADYITYIKEETKEYIIKKMHINSKKLYKIPLFIYKNMVNTSTKTLPKVLQYKDWDVVFIGRISFGKGRDFLFNMIKNSPNIKYALIGSANPNDPILKLPNVIHAKVPRKSIISILKKSKIFILPTLSEAGPLVTKEVVASQIPVIVSPQGTSEIVKNGFNGFIIDPKEFPTKGIQLIQRILTDKNLYNKLRENQKHMQKYVFFESKYIQNYINSLKRVYVN